MKYLMIGAAAAMAFVGAATLAQAQDEKSKGPAATEPGKAQPPQAEPRVPARTEADAGRDQPKATHPQKTDRPGNADGKHRAQEGTTDRAKGTEAPKRDADRPKSAEPAPTDRPKKTEKPEQGKDRQKASEPQAQDRPKRTEGPQRDQDLEKSTQEKGRDLTKSAEQPRQGERVRVTEQKRTAVRERLTKMPIEKARISVRVNIGIAVPRSVRLRPLPVAILDVAPEYRGYSYIVLQDDTICIVDQRTYLIVDVIGSGSEHADRPDGAQLTLSAEQMRFIFANVPREGATNVRVHLALGAEVPQDVELLAFPADVLRRLPEMKRYRYIIAGSDSDVVIVDPNDNAVVLVINE